jgi:hypothetical protein
VIVPELREHLDNYVGADSDAFLFLGAKGGFLHGGNFRREANWSRAEGDDDGTADALVSAV